MHFQRAATLGFAAIASLALADRGICPGAVDGSIAGVVKDTTGAVLPGVTVEAASPALIEKARTVVTDGQGAYKIVDLRPGTYTVTFTLTGLPTVKREGHRADDGVHGERQRRDEGGHGSGNRSRSPARARSSTCRTSCRRAPRRAR